ncbi:MAG: lipase family protein [Eggerthella lenta]
MAAYTLASKTIASDGDGKPVTLLFVGIRGTYGAEWLSNFNFLGAGSDDADHRGFKAAEEEVEKAVRSYASDLGIDPAHTRILITGHSRGGAIANLLAADLGDPDDDASALAPSSGIYAYTFAAPCATRADDRHDPRFGNIFNVVNEADIVTSCRFPPGVSDATVHHHAASTVSVDFDDSYAIVQTAYQRNTGYALGCDEDDFATLTFVQPPRAHLTRWSAHWASSVPCSRSSASTFRPR